MAGPTLVDDIDLQTLIIARVGDTAAGTLTANMPAIWYLYSYLPLQYPGGLGQQVQALYAQRDCVEIALASVRGLVDSRTGVQERKNSQQAGRLQTMLAATTAEITRVEALLRASRAPQVGTITAVVPEPNPFGQGFISADDVAFRGDPYTPFPGGVIGPPVTTEG